MKSTVLVAVCLISFASGANILGIFHTFSHSHYLFALPLLKELSENGHNITTVTYKSSGTKSSTFHEVVPQFVDKYETVVDDFRKSTFENTEKSSFGMFLNFSSLGKDMNIDLCTCPEMMDLRRNGVKYDLLILEAVGGEGLLGFSIELDAPVIGISSVRTNPWIQSITGTPVPTAFVTTIFSQLSSEMNFIERVKNFLITYLLELFRYFIMDPPQVEAFNLIWPNSQKSMHELRKEVFSLILMNSHVSLDGPQPLMTNIIEVGGMQINTKTKDLPKDMQNFMDSATEGVILFTLGSNLDASYIHKEKRDAIVDVLSKQKMKVILKWDHPESVAEQVAAGKFFISKWVPQSDLLGHKNMRLFITHGGLGGTTETIYHGVPVVVIPIFADQQQNAENAKGFGIGVRVDYTNLTETSLSWAVGEIQNNPKYSDIAKTLSERYRDRPQSSMETAKFWVEYVIRHKGARFLRSPALKLNFFQYHSLDVYAFLIAVVFVVIYIVKVTFKWIFRKLFRTNKLKTE